MVRRCWSPPRHDRQVLGCLAGISGLAGALTLLAQTRTMLRARRACEISLLLLSKGWTAGYAIKLAYGLALENAVMVTVNAAGTAGAAAARRRGRLRRRAPCEVAEPCFTGR